MDGPLKQRMLQILECKICISTPFPKSPVKVCQNGHLLCSACEPQAGEQCHLCRHAGSRIRVNIIEEVIQLLGIENDPDLCRYCEMEGVKSHIRLHEAFCELKNVECPTVSIPTSLTSRCRLKNRPKPAVREHFKNCIKNKIFALPFSGQKKFVSYFSHLYLNVDGNRLGNEQMGVNYSNFYTNFVNYQPIRIASPFFSHFLSHIVFFRRILNHQAVFYFGVKMQLLEEFCSEIKLKFCFAKDENFSSNVVEKVVSPISQYAKPLDFYLNPNLLRISANEAAALNSVHVFSFFYIEVQNFGELAKEFPENLGFAHGF